MIRKLILVLAILAVAATPLPAHARGGGHGSHGHDGHHHGHHHGHFHHFGGLYTPFPYDYPCWWERGHWVDQLYMDKYGYTTTVSQWVPGQWMCW